MYPFKDHFTVYHKYDGGRMIMGKSTMCKVIRIGNVKLKLHDGSFFDLKQVRHVLDLKRNLISLEIMD